MGEILCDSDKEMIVMKISRNMTSNNIFISKKFGPLNKGKHECVNSINEECRMLTCFCHVDTADNEWFTGFCNECNEEIKKESLCIREPCMGGGWRDCYCSIECLSSITSSESFEVKCMIKMLEINLSTTPIKEDEEEEDDSF